MNSEKIIKELRKEIDKILQSGKSLRSYRIYQYLDMLEKDNITLSECIKEWNAKGFDVDIYALEIAIHNRCSVDNEEHSVEFTIKLKNKTLFMEGEYNSFPYDVVHLLSKTLKALEEENKCLK